MRRNARVAFVLWRAGPPRGHEATPDRAVRRPYWGAANLRDCSHARLVWAVRNESRILSLMSAVEVNSGTGTTRQCARQKNSRHKNWKVASGPPVGATHSMTRQKRKPRLGGSGAFNVGLRGLGDLGSVSDPSQKRFNEQQAPEAGFLLQARQAASRRARHSAQWWPSGLVGPSALAASAFEHVDDRPRVGNHHRPDMPEFFIAEATGLAGLVHDGRNLLGAKQLHGAPPMERQDRGVLGTGKSGNPSAV